MFKKSGIYRDSKTIKISAGAASAIGWIIAGVGFVALIAILIVSVLFDGYFGKKIVVKNKSSHKITKLSIWYEDDLTEITDVMELGEIAAKAKKEESTEALKLDEISGQAWFTMRITFEDGGEAELQSGQVLNNFEGRLLIEVADTSDKELTIRLKAGEGLFNSSFGTECDDVYYINPENGYVE